MTEYVIKVDGVEQKRYHLKELALIWCIMHGYVADGESEFGEGHFWFLDERVKIVEVEDD